MFFDGRGLPLVGTKLMIIKQKTWESVSVAVLLLEASRIALSMSDGNAEAHACICKAKYGRDLLEVSSI